MQSLSEHGGGGNGGTPSSRSTRYTPRGGPSGFSNGAGSKTPVSATSSSGSGSGGSGGGCGGGCSGSASASKGKWEFSGKRRSPEREAGRAKSPQQAVEQGSAFVRDFIRGAGIHRLDPRRLSGGRGGKGEAGEGRGGKSRHVFAGRGGVSRLVIVACDKDGEGVGGWRTLLLLALL